MFVQTVDARTTDIMRREETRNKENTEPDGTANVYTIMRMDKRKTYIAFYKFIQNPKPQTLVTNLCGGSSPSSGL